MAPPFESRAHRDGSHYVVESTSGHLAHTEDSDGSLRAAIGLGEAEAQEVAERLSATPEETS